MTARTKARRPKKVISVVSDIRKLIKLARTKIEKTETDIHWARTKLDLIRHNMRFISDLSHGLTNHRFSSLIKRGTKNISRQLNLVRSRIPNEKLITNMCVNAATKITGYAILMVGLSKSASVTSRTRVRYIGNEINATEKEVMLILDWGAALVKESSSVRETVMSLRESFIKHTEDLECETRL